MLISSLCFLKDCGAVHLEHASIQEAMETCRASTVMGVTTPPRVVIGNKVYHFLRQRGSKKFKLIRSL